MQVASTKKTRKCLVAPRLVERLGLPDEEPVMSRAVAVLTGLRVLAAFGHRSFAQTASM